MYFRELRVAATAARSERAAPSREAGVHRQGGRVCPSIDIQLGVDVGNVARVGGWADVETAANLAVAVTGNERSHIFDLAPGENLRRSGGAVA